MHAAFFLASILAADPYSAIAPGKPTIPAPLSSLTRGMTESAVLSALKVSEDDVCMLLGARVKSLCVVPFFKDKLYDHPALLFPSLAKTREALTKRWGQPIVYQRDWYWVNPAAKVRARLRDQDDPAMLHLETYLPLKEFLGEGPALAFEHTPILGSTRTALEKAYGITCEGDRCVLVFPPCEVDWANQSVQIELTGDTATQVTLILPTRSTDLFNQTIKLLEMKWGDRVPIAGEKSQFNFEKEPRARLFMGDELMVRIRRWP